MYTMLVISVATELEEELVDCLLEIPDIEEFSSSVVYAHGHSERMTLAEQVRGRRKRLQMELILPAQSVNKVLTLLRENLGGDGVYWEQAVRNFGRFSDLT